jgi:hypothetical protein
MDHFSKARQDELLRVADPGQGPAFEQADMAHPKEHGFIRRLIGAFSRRKALPAAVPARSGKGNQELGQA